MLFRSATCVRLARDGAGEEEALLATTMGHHGEPEEIAAGAPTAKVQGAADPPPAAYSFSRGRVPAPPDLVASQYFPSG